MAKLLGTPENREKYKSLAQQIFPRLWYTVLHASSCEINDW